MRTPDEQNARWLGDLGPEKDEAFVFQVLDGLLLGDAYLDKKGSLRIEQSWSHAGWIRWLEEALPKHGCGCSLITIPPKTKLCEGREIRGGGGLALYTPVYKDFKPQRNRWYPNGVKQVPSDLKLTPLVVSQWLCGDGTYARDGSLTFCTDGFDKPSVDLLSKMLLQEFAVHSRVRLTHRGQPHLHIQDKRSALLLADLVRPLIPDCFQYKLQYTRLPKKGGCPPKLQRQVVQDRLTSGISKTALARELGVSVGTLYNTLKREVPK